MFHVCLIGAGRAGMIHARNFRSRVPRAKLTAIVDASCEAAQNAARELHVDTVYPSAQAAFDDKNIHGVVIVAPTKFHKELVLAAAKAGKHILCEKPLAMNEAECREMIRACEKYRVLFQVGFMRRYDESYQAAKTVIDSGEIGDIVLVKSFTRGPSRPQPWMYDLSLSNGPLAEVNSHDIDTIRWFSGSNFDTVFATGRNARCPDAIESYPDFYDNVALLGTLKSGAQVLMDGAQGVEYGYDAGTQVIGTRGSVSVGRKADMFITVATREGGARTPFISSWRRLFQDAYLKEDESFVQCALSGEGPLATGHDGLAAVQVVEAGNRSIQTHMPVRLQPERM